jgi:hypothetical protein
VFLTIDLADHDAKFDTQLNQILVIPTFTVLLALAFVYQLVLLYDTLANENNIQCAQERTRNEGEASKNATSKDIVIERCCHRKMLSSKDAGLSAP